MRLYAKPAPSEVLSAVIDLTLAKREVPVWLRLKEIATNLTNTSPKYVGLVLRDHGMDPRESRSGFSLYVTETLLEHLKKCLETGLVEEARLPPKPVRKPIRATEVRLAEDQFQELLEALRGTTISQRMEQR